MYRFYFMLFLILSGLCNCGDSNATTKRESSSSPNKNPVYPKVDSTSTSTVTDTSTSTVTGTSTSTDTTTSLLGTRLLDNSPPVPLKLTTGTATADRLADCPNTVCLLDIDPDVSDSLLNYTSTAVNTSNATTTFSPEAAPVRNYFKTVCLVTRVIDLFQPIYYQNCSTVAGEAFFIDIDESTSLFRIHPASNHNLCINAPGAAPQVGIMLDLDTCNGSAGQLWRLDNTTTPPASFVHPSQDSSLCVVRGGDRSGNQVIGLWDCASENTMLMWESISF